LPHIGAQECFSGLVAPNKALIGPDGEGLFVIWPPRIRRQTVEHPFGTIKLWMGSAHFLTKTLDRVGTEMGLHVLAYNLKRVMKILGNDALIAAMRA
jgi:hypothetical protein